MSKIAWLIAAFITALSIAGAGAQSRLYSCPHAQVLELTVTGPDSLKADPVNGKPMAMKRDAANPLRFVNKDHSVTLSQDHGSATLEVPKKGAVECIYGTQNVTPLFPKRGAEVSPCGPGFHPVPQTDRCDPDPGTSPNARPRRTGTADGVFPMGGQSLGGIMRAAPSMIGLDLAQEVSTREPYEWTETEWQLGHGHGRLAQPRLHVVAYDFGIKRNILRMLASRGCRVTVVPARTPAATALALKPDGIFLSNGPGDPDACDYAVEACRELVASGVPTFGICLGHQIMALAAGAKTFKMKFGHHGANHPVKELASGKVCITSQNHGFAVDAKTLGASLCATHVSLFDGSLQGMAVADKPAFSFQGHPEAIPGPHDIGHLFDRFVALMEER